MASTFDIEIAQQRARLLGLATFDAALVAVGEHAADAGFEVDFGRAPFN